MRLPINPRMKATMVMWRRLGYSITAIQAASGRSSSIIHTVLRRAADLGILRRIDNRKLPRMVKLWNARRRIKTLLDWLPKWENFICGEEAEPP